MASKNEKMKGNIAVVNWKAESVDRNGLLTISFDQSFSKEQIKVTASEIEIGILKNGNDIVI